MLLDKTQKDMNLMYGVCHRVDVIGDYRNIYKLRPHILYEGKQSFAFMWLNYVRNLTPIRHTVSWDRVCSSDKWKQSLAQHIGYVSISNQYSTRSSANESREEKNLRKVVFVRTSQVGYIAPIQLSIAVFVGLNSKQHTHTLDILRMFLLCVTNFVQHRLTPR